MKQSEQAEQSRQWLMDALLALMEKRSFESITVTDITKKAGVARLTFYRHYESKEQIIEDYYSDTFNRFIEEITQASKVANRDALCRCFEYWRQEEKVVKTLVRHNMKDLLYDNIESYFRCIDGHGSSFYNAFQKKFIGGGLITALIEWVLNPQGYSAEEMADMLWELLNRKL